VASLARRWLATALGTCWSLPMRRSRSPVPCRTGTSRRSARKQPPQATRSASPTGPDTHPRRQQLPGAEIAAWGWEDAPARKLRQFTSDLPAPALAALAAGRGDRRLTAALNGVPEPAARRRAAAATGRACGLRIGGTARPRAQRRLRSPRPELRAEAGAPGNLDPERMAPLDDETLTLVDRILVW
jgi:hypothetical protein